MHDKADLKRLVKIKALELGFEQVGFAKAQALTDEANNLEKWLNGGMHGTMAWMEGHFDKRIDPTKLVEGAKTVISATLQYHPGTTERPENTPRISTYALGDDYHDVLRGKLKALYDYIHDLVGDINGRVFTDSAPVMDKAWAARSGMGWLGKNGNLLNRKLGSWFFIGEIILDVDFEPDSPTTDHCGSCTRCIDACPTNAIVLPQVIDARKCISYLTIEYRDAIPESYHKGIGEWMYGCDICQDVCPWNRKAPTSKEQAFKPRKEILEMTAEGWRQLDVETFKRLFKGSAVKRTKYAGLVRNISIAVSNVDGKTD
jgi:epoxyqueuosine reductase